MWELSWVFFELPVTMAKRLSALLLQIEGPCSAIYLPLMSLLNSGSSKSLRGKHVAFTALIADCKTCTTAYSERSEKLMSLTCAQM